MTTVKISALKDKECEKLRISIKDIHKREFSRENFSYVVKVSSGRINVEIIFKNAAYYFITGERKAFNERGVSIQQKGNFFQIQLKLNLMQIIKNNDNEYTEINFLSKGVELCGTLRINQDELTKIKESLNRKIATKADVPKMTREEKARRKLSEKV